MSPELETIQKEINSNPIIVNISSANKDHTQIFARIRLHGLTKSSTDGAPSPIDLERRISFPMPAYFRNEAVIEEHDIDLSARSLSPMYDIEARVCFDRPTAQEPELEGSLGEGRTGIVYPLEILSFKRASSHNQQSNDDGAAFEGPLETPTLPPLCIKVAKPGYARNMAREAWFYERLDGYGLTGLVAPRCYGVFHTTVPDGLTIDIPGFAYYEEASKPIYMEEEETYGIYTDGMREEYFDEDIDDLVVQGRNLMDDAKKSYTQSEWRFFRETPEKTTLTVLVMDKLGERITLEDFERDWEPDLEHILDHLVPLDIVNSDFSFRNILRVPPHLQVPCPLHPNIIPGHKWHFIDWELAKIIRTGPPLSSATWALRSTWAQRWNLECDYYSAGGKNTIVFRREVQGNLLEANPTVASTNKM